MIHLCIYAVATIAKDTEVTIAFDYEYNIWWVLHLAQELSTALLDWTSFLQPFPRILHFAPFSTELHFPAILSSSAGIFYSRGHKVACCPCFGTWWDV